MEHEIKFPVGDILLEGLLSLPDAPRGGVVVCHPHPLYGGDMHNNVVSGLVAALQGEGYATFRFNFRGVGGSQGTHDEGRGEVDDVAAAVDVLASRAAMPLLAVAGYSFGSIVGLKAGARDGRVGALIGVALPLARRDAEFLSSVTKPKLLVCGSRDDIGPERLTRALFEKLPEPKSLVVVNGADHFFAGLEGDVGRAARDFLETVGN